MRADLNHSDPNNLSISALANSQTLSSITYPFPLLLSSTIMLSLTY